MEYQQLNAEKYEQQFRERELRHLQRKAARLGFTLIPAGAVFLAASGQVALRIPFGQRDDSHMMILNCQTLDKQLSGR